jgi:hypothetical protein
MPLAAGGAAMPPLGPTSTSRAVDQINRSSTRPLPTVPQPPVTRDPMIWVPSRAVPVDGGGTATVPGHWERRLPDTRDVYVPPLPVQRGDTGTVETVPGGIRPPVEERHSAP